MEPADIYKKYLDSILHFLSFRPRSEKEIRDNLIKKKASQEIIEQIITWLKQQKFLDDEEFTRWWIEQRSKFRPKSMRIIKLELKQKGIAQQVIDGVVEDPESKIQNDLESAKKIVEKKFPKYKGLSKYELYQKLGAVLARKGFNWETIKKSIDISLDQELG
jgi:regulatory protein